ncbi:MAG TPA: serine/threonine-protein kinase, partial [Planctomycetota bacterium]|nr:serine/threonine-protein kinase [Planctomycetota bacterium]
MANEKNDGARESPGQQAPARGKLSDHLLEAGLRAVFAAGAQSPPPPPRPLETEVPQRIGRYDVVDVIGQGGVGVVLKARDAELRREIAIKLLLPSHGRNPGIRHRFIEESQVAGQLEHPGIVSVHEAGLFDGDRPYFTMKLVKGRTLAALLQERENVVADRVRFLGIFEQVAQTIAYAHSRGVIHRDLKPSNIMVGAFGEVQVMDWGLAKVIARDLTAAESAVDGSLPAGLRDEVRTLRTDAADSRSLAGSVLGTPAYMAPEQARGE